MHPRFGALAKTIVICLALCVIGAALRAPIARSAPKPAPCPAARYLIVGAPLVVSEPTGATASAVQVGSLVSFDGLCEPAAGKLRAVNRKRVTQVRATWSACAGLTGKVRLKARITDDCTQLHGTLKAKKLKRRFDALLSRCGDGILDQNGGETCDDGNTVAGDGCEPDCSVTVPPSVPATSTTSTTVATTSTTTIIATTSTTVTATTTTTSSTAPTSTSGTTSTTRATTTTTTTTLVTTSTIGATTTTTTPGTTTTTTLPKPDLGLAMVVSPDPVALGGLLTWSLTVTNRGPGAASGLVLRMPVPSGLYGTAGCRAVSDGGVPPGNCVAGQSIQWNLGTLAAGTSRTVQFVGLVTVSGLADGTNIHATAQAMDGPTGASASADVDAVVGNTAPLDLTLGETSDPVRVGDALEYVLRFGNRSGSPQLTTTLTLALPAGTTVLDAGGATVAAGTAIWTLGTVNGGQAGERRLRVQVDDLGAADPLVRVARATLMSASASARASVVAQVEASVPLGLVMVATPDPVGLGDLLHYELTVTNRRAGDAAGVVVLMRVPEGLYGTAGCREVSDNGVPPGNCISGRDIEWDLGALAAHESRTVQFTGLVTVSGLPDGSLIHAVARAQDAAGAAARADVTTTVASTPPLVLTLDESSDPVSVGDGLEYVLRFGNASGSPQLTTTLALALPAGTTVLDAGGATVAAGTATWTLGTVNGGEAGERRLRVQVTDLGVSDPLVRVARAVVASGAVAARAAVVTQIEAATPLGLVMVASPDAVGLGGLLTYSLTVTNAGAVDAAGVVLRMPLPQGLYGTAGCREVSDAGVVPGNCVAGADIEWDLGGIAAGASRTVQFTGLVTVSGLPDGTLIHGTARVEDANGDAARSAVTTTVGTAAPLVLTLDESDDPVAAGDALEYVLRFGNRSASPLLTTTLALTLPAGATVLDAGGATVSSDTATWTLGTLNGGQAGERRLRVHVEDLGAADPLVRVARAVVASGAVAARAGAVTQVEAAPLGLVMVATPDPVGLGGLLTYSLTVTNAGAADAAGVVLRMPVPEGLYGTAGCRAVTDGGMGPGNCVAGVDIEWDLGGIAAGASRTVQFTGLVTVSGLADGTLLHATARVGDVNGDAARAAVTTLVTTSATAAPLVVTLDETSDPTGFGESLEYVLRFGNRSTNPLLPTTLALTLPPGTAVLDAGGATVSSGTATWALGTVNAGQTGERRLRVQVDDLGAADPLVRVARAVLASGAVAARAGAVTQVETSSPLSLTMGATPDPVGLNGLLAYSLTVMNGGAVDLAGVTLRMPVPEGLYGTAGCQAVSDGGVLPPGCVAGRDIEWNLGGLAAGASRTVTFTGHVTVSGLPDGTLIHAAARVGDASGGAARAGTTNAVN